LEKINQSHALRRLERSIVLEQRQTHHDVREPFFASGIGNLLHVLDQSRDVQKLRNGGHFFGLLVDHQGCSDAAVRMTTAAYLPPFSFGSMDQIGEVRKSSHQRNREPIPRWLCNADLFFHVARHMRQSISLSKAPVRRYVFITTCKGNRLKGNK